MTLPHAARPFVDFASVLRAHGFAVAPEQTIGFLQAVGLLGPRDMTDIHRAARALFAAAPEDMARFDALFQAFFMGQAVEAPAVTRDGEEMQAHEATGDSHAVEAAEEDDPGVEATAAERLGQRALAPEDDRGALFRLSRDLPARLPRRRSARRVSARTGDSIDRRRTLRLAARADGEVLRLAARRRKLRQRRLLLLIDVSGSMSDSAEDRLRFAHALMQTAQRVEAFTLGTRLTRITPALRLADPARALEQVSQTVADFDGGTRIGEALSAFLAIPRYAAFARGAAVMVLSDGLERDDPAGFIQATRHLARLAWRLDWLTPLAADPGYRPETQALRAILPYLTHLGDGATIPVLVAHALELRSP